MLKTNKGGILGNRRTTLEKATNNSLPSIKATLENKQHRVDGIEADAWQSTPETHRREPRQDQSTLHEVHEDYTDSEVEEEGLSTHVRMKDTYAGTVCAQQSNRQATDSYFSRTRSSRVDQAIKGKRPGYESNSSSEDD